MWEKKGGIFFPRLPSVFTELERPEAQEAFGFSLSLAFVLDLSFAGERLIRSKEENERPKAEGLRSSRLLRYDTACPPPCPPPHTSTLYRFGVVKKKFEYQPLPPPA